MTQPYRQDRQDVHARQMAAQAMQRANAMTQQMAAAVPSQGTAVVPALSLGASTQVVVTISPPISGSYVAVPVLLASATLLAGLTVGGIVAKTETTVTVLVRAPLVAVAAGAVLQIVAFKTT